MAAGTAGAAVVVAAAAAAAAAAADDDYVNFWVLNTSSTLSSYKYMTFKLQHNIFYMNNTFLIYNFPCPAI